MARYRKCPRCELNYIELEKEYCDVCLAEMRGGKLRFADLDEDEEAEKTELCPVCGENYMLAGEKMCEECKKKEQYEEDTDIDPEKDEEWRNYLDEEPEEEGALAGDDLDFEDDLDEEDLESDDYADKETDDLDFEDDLQDIDDEDDEDDDSFDDESDEDDDF